VSLPTNDRKTPWPKATLWIDRLGRQATNLLYDTPTTATENTRDDGENYRQ